MIGDGALDLGDFEDTPRQAIEDEVRPDILAATIAIRRSVPLAIRRAFMRRDPIVVILTVPSADWCIPTLNASSTIFGDGSQVKFDGLRGDRLYLPRVYFMRDGTEKTAGRRDQSAARLAAFLGQGGSAIGIAADTALLPDELIAASDHTIDVQPLTPRDLLRIVRKVASGRTKLDIDERVAASTSPSDLAMAVRPRTTAASCVARLRRIVGQRRVTPIAETVPSFQNLAGYGAAKSWGLSLMRDLERFRADPSSTGIATLTRSVLLAGPPGTGKTLFARALAKGLGVPLVETGYGMWSTAGGGYLSDAMTAIKHDFATARAAAKTSGSVAVLFIDELDSLPNRAALRGGRNDPYWSSLVNLVLTLTELSSPERAGVVLVGATNFVDRIDAALKRAGRFDTVIPLHLPDSSDLAAIMRTHLRSELADADLASIATMAPPSSGADAARWIREARRIARDRGTPMCLADIAAQVAPPEDRSPEELRCTALHEAAHAVAAMVVGYSQVVRLSLVYRDGRAGETEFDAPDTAATRDAIERRVVVTLAGRAADEFFGTADAGSGGMRFSDLAIASIVMCSAHASFGLGESLVSLADPDRCAELLVTDRALRRVVEADLRRLYGEAQGIVARHAVAIEAVATALVEARVLSGDDVARIIASVGSKTLRPRGAS